MSPTAATGTLNPRRPGLWTPALLNCGGVPAWIAANLVIAALYFALGLAVSRFFAAYGLFPAPIWLSASVAMVGAMIGGMRVLPGLFLGSVLANAVLFAPPPHITAIISATNALGPVAGALLLRRLRPEGRLFTSFAGVTAFLVCTTFVSPAISAVGGTLALAIGHPTDLAQSYSTWVNWWLSDSGGTLYLAPALILWLGLEQEDCLERPEDDRRISPRDLAVWLLIAAASTALFLAPPLNGNNIREAFPFLLVVPLSWIALKMSLRSAYTLISLVAVAATAGTVAGVGPFQSPTLANPLQLVGTLVVLLAMNVLTIVALVSERHRAQNANRVKAMFLAKTSHELRTPLNAIIGFSSLLDQQALGPLANEEYAGYARLIRSSGEHLLALINGLLEISKIEAGRVDLREERIQVADAIEEAAALFGPAAHEKSIRIEVAPVAHDIVVEADPKALRQILLNLLSNAVKFTPGGGRVTIEAERGRDGELVIHVSDSGIGIPPDALARLFTPFERADRHATEAIEGTGLGLSITKGLITLHGGTVALESVVGQGTTVAVTLPADRVVGVDGAARQSPRARAAA
jgi:signal transduction histidine kinase